MFGWNLGLITEQLHIYIHYIISFPGTAKKSLFYFYFCKNCIALLLSYLPECAAFSYQAADGQPRCLTTESWSTSSVDGASVKQLPQTCRVSSSTQSVCSKETILFPFVQLGSDILLLLQKLLSIGLDIGGREGKGENLPNFLMSCTKTSFPDKLALILCFPLLSSPQNGLGVKTASYFLGPYYS